ncbi:MAG: 4-phosphoerythronate dehydrogenase [Xanthomonadales bacterium]
MKIVIDRNIRGAAATFGRHGELQAMDGRAIRRADLVDADVLIVRTATRVDRDLLDGTPVRFVGTTSIGTDHLDIPYLDAAGIAWSNAPGCNADSAAEYTLAMMWLACERLGRRLADQRVGVIGCGNVGSRVQRLLRAIGVDSIANDPPLADRGVAGLVAQDEALSCDIVSLHVPLTHDGPYPTHRMIDADRLAGLPAGALLVNAARGDVIDGDALLDAVRAGRIRVALDCWPGEPLIEPELLQRSTVATPHVAGYSDDGKRNGTRMVYEAYCRSAGIAPSAPAPDSRRLALSIDAPETALDEALTAACFVARHDGEMRRLATEQTAGIARGFDRLRKNYPFRRDFQGWDVDCPDRASARLLTALGFAAHGG